VVDVAESEDWSALPARRESPERGAPETRLVDRRLSIRSIDRHLADAATKYWWLIFG
jgi:hypothetical protein